MPTSFSIPVDQEIVLKLPTLKNAPELFALVDRNRKFLRKHLPWVDHNQTVEDSRRFIQECRKQFKKNNGFSLCIFYQGKIVGTMGPNSIDSINRKAEIGYWLSEDQQGKGIMHRSCQALIHYYFKVKKLHRIEIQCAKYNMASQHVAEKLGFTKEAILRESTYLNRRFHDTILYSKLAH